MASNPTTPTSNSTNAESRPKMCRRFALLLLLVQTTLFWEGCSPSDQALFSVGLAGPVITVGFVDPGTPQSVGDFSPRHLIGNLCLIAGAVLLLACAPAHWARRLTSWQLIVASSLVTCIFNSVLYFFPLCTFLVLTPVWWLHETFVGIKETDSNGVLGIISRVYFLFSVAVIWSVLGIIRAVSRRWLFIGDSRWQFSLAGLLATMVIVGTALGMLLRLVVET